MEWFEKCANAEWQKMRRQVSLRALDEVEADANKQAATVMGKVKGKSVATALWSTGIGFAGLITGNSDLLQF